MVRHLRLASLSTLLLATLAARAAEPDAGKIDRLIRQLGSEKFREREAATKALQEIGGPALPALWKAFHTSDDPEVRLRADRLVEAICCRGQATVRALGGEIQEDEDAAGKPFLSVNLSGTKAADADLAHLQWLGRVEPQPPRAGRGKVPEIVYRNGADCLNALDLSGTRVTDAGLAHLEGLRKLKRLSLRATAVTDAGLAHLAGLEHLQMLALARTRVTGAGLAHLAGLANLRCLYLSGAPVTDAVLARLREFPRLRHLDLSRTSLGDANLARLGKLQALEWLDLSGTRVTDQGLPHLRPLGRLRFLRLGGNRVTTQGLIDNRKGMPDLMVSLGSAPRRVAP
jgi:hypothetical protein